MYACNLESQVLGFCHGRVGQVLGLGLNLDGQVIGFGRSLGEARVLI